MFVVLFCGSVQLFVVGSCQFAMGAQYDEKLPAHNYEYAEKTLGETKENRDRCLMEIQQWLDDNPKINANRDIVSLIHFLRGAKFQMEKAKKRIET